jgi:hypothetical protein
MGYVHRRGSVAGVPDLDRVSLDIGGRELFVMSWDDREKLLARLEPMAGAETIVKAIRDAGATRPALLRPVDQVALYGALALWRERYLVGQLPRMPRRVEELRYLLGRELSIDA